MTKRQFRSQTPILKQLGIADFDQAGKIADLKINLKSANRKFIKQFKTKNEDKIDKIVKKSIIREVIGIQERNEARKFAANKPRKQEEFRSDQGNNDDDQFKSNRSNSEYGGKSSFSPNKSIKTTSPIKQTNSVGNLQSVLKKPSEHKLDKDSFESQSYLKTTFKIDGDPKLVNVAIPQDHQDNNKKYEN